MSEGHTETVNHRTKIYLGSGVHYVPTQSGPGLGWRKVSAR